MDQRLAVNPRNWNERVPVHAASDFYDVAGFNTGGGAIASPCYEWQHSMAEIVNALLAAGLRLQFIHEFPFSNYRALPGMGRGADGWWRLPERTDSIPLLFSLRAAKARPRQGTG